MQQQGIYCLWEKQFLQNLTTGFSSTSLSSSKQKCQYNAIFSSLELVHSFEWVHSRKCYNSLHSLLLQPDSFSSKRCMPLTRMGLLSHQYEASSTQYECICPTTSEVWSFSGGWGCFAEFREFWSDTNNRKKLAPRSLCLSLIFVVTNHSWRYDRQEQLDLTLKPALLWAGAYTGYLQRCSIIWILLWFCDTLAV